jgi:hypothetical protein
VFPPAKQRAKFTLFLNMFGWGPQKGSVIDTDKNAHLCVYILPATRCANPLPRATTAEPVDGAIVRGRRLRPAGSACRSGLLLRVGTGARHSGEVQQFTRTTSIRREELRCGSKTTGYGLLSKCLNCSESDPPRRKTPTR